MNRVFLALGSNIKKEENLAAAVALLQIVCQVDQIASVYETAPVGLTDQPIFWNTAVQISTPLDPIQIKQEIIGVVEKKLNRQRTKDKNAPRTIDVDIALFNDAVLDFDPGDGRLRHIPDPDLLRFLHVMVPVAELAPDMPHPVTRQSLASIAAELMAENVSTNNYFRRANVKLIGQ